MCWGLPQVSWATSSRAMTSSRGGRQYTIPSTTAPWPTPIRLTREKARCIGLRKTCGIWAIRQALQQIEKALAVAHSLSHPFSLCFALIFAGYVHRFRGEVSQVQAYAKEVKAIATAHEFPHWRQYGEML